MLSGEELWKAPENAIYMVQGCKENGVWEFASSYLYTIPEAQAYIPKQWGYSMMRIVRVSRYLPGKDMDPVVVEIVKVVKQEK